jgi:hypothetical protein
MGFLSLSAAHAVCMHGGRRQIESKVGPNGITFLTSLLLPKSVGHVRVVSADPLVYPEIEANYCQDAVRPRPSSQTQRHSPCHTQTERRAALVLAAVTADPLVTQTHIHAHALLVVVWLWG